MNMFAVTSPGFRKAVLLAMCAVALPTSVRADILNPNFDTDLSDWDENGSTSWDVDDSRGHPPYTGSAKLDANGSSLSQWFDCHDELPFATCHVLFWYKSDIAPDPDNPVLQAVLDETTETYTG